MTRKFEIYFDYDEEETYEYAIIELDDVVIDAVDDEWRETFYDLYTPEQIAGHIAYNLFINKISLSLMDGWASLPDDMVSVIKSPNLNNWGITAKELKI